MQEWFFLNSYIDDKSDYIRPLNITDRLRMWYPPPIKSFKFLRTQANLAHLSTGWSCPTSRLQTLQYNYLQSHLSPIASSYSSRRPKSKSSVTAIKLSSANWSAQFVTKPSRRPSCCASPGILSVASVHLGWPYAPYVSSPSPTHTTRMCRIFWLRLLSSVRAGLKAVLSKCLSARS